MAFDHLVEDPALRRALPERLDVVVLLHVERVEDREHAEEVRLRQRNIVFCGTMIERWNWNSPKLVMVSPATTRSLKAQPVVLMSHRKKSR
jgi:hypothetical protein